MDHHIKTMAILQLTNIKDSLDLLVSVSDLKKQAKGIKVILITNINHVSPIKAYLQRDFDMIYDAEDIDQIQDEISVLVNLSFSRQSSLLASKIVSKHKLGPYYDEKDHSIRINDYWSQYICSNILEGNLNTFSLVDIYKGILGLEFQEHIKEKSPSSPSKEGSHLLIAPFSNDKRTTFKISKWADILWKLLNKREDLTVTILAQKEQQKLLEEFLNFPLIEGIQGHLKTCLIQNDYHLLEKEILNANFLISCDENISSFSSLFDIKSLHPCFGYTKIIENLPYKAKTFALSARKHCYPCSSHTECLEGHSCQGQISSQEFIDIILYLLEDDPPHDKNFVKKFQTSSFDLYEAYFSKSHLYRLKKIFSEELSDHDMMKSFYQIAWAYFLLEKEESLPFPKIKELGKDFILQYMGSLKNLFKLYEFGKIFSEQILYEIAKSNPNLNQIKMLSGKIDETSTLSEKLVSSFPYLKPILQYQKISLANLYGSHIVELTQSSYLCFSSLSSIVAILYDLMESTLKDYTQKAQKNSLYSSFENH